MRFSSLLLSGLLSSLAIAQPLDHGHHVHKREAEVVTVVVTQVVTNKVADAEPTASVVPFNVVGTNTAQTTSTPTTTTLLQSTVEVVSSSASKASSSSTKTSPSGTSTSVSTGSIAFASGGKGITYSPYTNSGTCKDAATVAEDLAKLTQFDIIRIYDTDCSSVENVLAAKTSNQKIFLGIFYLSKIASSVSIISDAVSNVDGGWDNIYSVGVGNELVNNGEATTDQISSAISEARAALTSVGYTGSVVSVDTLVAVQNNPALCEYSDFIAVNSHPFWDGNVAPADSGSFLKTQIANIKSICGGEKEVLICETGWPTQGSSYGNCVPSIENQITAVTSIVEEVGDQVLLFTLYNDYWKSPGSYGVEQYWGLIQN